eukprot:428488_1
MLQQEYLDTITNNTRWSKKLKNPISQQTYLDTTKSNVRRSKRLKEENIISLKKTKTDSYENKAVWHCNCCDQIDIDDYNSTCIRCQSPKIDSITNLDANKKHIIKGYCHQVTHVPLVITKLIQHYLTLQRANFTFIQLSETNTPKFTKQFKFQVIWNRREVDSILDNYLRNSVEYVSQVNAKCFAKYPKKAKILQTESSKFNLICLEDLINTFRLMRAKRDGNINKETNEYIYWYIERTPMWRPTITDIMHKAPKSKAQQYQLKNMNLLKKILVLI